MTVLNNIAYTDTRSAEMNTSIGTRRKSILNRSHEDRMSLYPILVHHMHIRNDFMRDMYTLQVRKKESTNVYLVIVKQHASPPSVGVQEIRFNMQQWKALEFHRDKIDSMLQNVINDSDFSKFGYFIAGPIHADIFFGAERGPTVHLYMGHYNHVKQVIEKDNFDVISVDLEGWCELSEQFKTLNAMFPALRREKYCRNTHKSRTETSDCDNCNPWGSKFKI